MPKPDHGTRHLRLSTARARPPETTRVCSAFDAPVTVFYGYLVIMVYASHMKPENRTVS